MSSLRIRALEHLERNGMMPYPEVAAGLKEDPQRTRQALRDASGDGLVEFAKDEVTGQGAYKLTAKGKARVLAGRQQIANGKTAAENAKDCAEREAAYDGLSAEARASVALDGDTHFADDATLARLAVLEREHAEFYEKWHAERRRADALGMENAILSDRIVSDRAAAAGGGYAMREPLGYAVMLDGDDLSVLATEAVARADAEAALAESDISQVHVVAILGTARIIPATVEWSRP